MKYNFSDLERMRVALENSFYRIDDQARTDRLIEDRLRTHMQNGTTPEELEQAADDFQKKWLMEIKESMQKR